MKAGGDWRKLRDRILRATTGVLISDIFDNMLTDLFKGGDHDDE